MKVTRLSRRDDRAIRQGPRQPPERERAARGREPARMEPARRGREPARRRAVRGPGRAQPAMDAGVRRRVRREARAARQDHDGAAVVPPPARRRRVGHHARDRASGARRVLRRREPRAARQPAGRQAQHGDDRGTVERPRLRVLLSCRFGRRCRAVGRVLRRCGPHAGCAARTGRAGRTHRRARQRATRRGAGRRQRHAGVLRLAGIELSRAC